MRYRYSTELSKSHCESVIKHNVDFFSFTLDGGEFIGWTKRGYFSIFFSALICLFNAAISWIFTNISEDGQENEDLLIEFLKDGLELRE